MQVNTQNNYSIQEVSIHAREILKCKSQIVKDYTHVFIHDDPQSFLGKDLITWCMENYDPNGYVQNHPSNARKLITQWINDYLMNPSLPFQLIFPAYPPTCKDQAYIPFKDSSKNYRFLDDHLEHSIYCPLILNLPMESSIKDDKKPFFYTQEYQNDEILQNPNQIVKEIRIKFLELRRQAMDDTSSSIDYEYLGQMPEFKEGICKQMELLAYANVQELMNDENQKTAFFINLYNILGLHSIIMFGREKGHYNITRQERITFYNKYRYSIGGYNYTLDDIEHGILRNNDSIGKNSLKKFWKLITNQTLSDKDSLRFKTTDPRFKMVKKDKVDPRVHFTLNCGVRSCPPIKVYNPARLENQYKMAARNFVLKNITFEQRKNYIRVNLNQILNWYKGDFGRRMKDILGYLQEYAQPNQVEFFNKIVKENQKFKVEYEPYDWTVNHKKKTQKIINQVDENEIDKSADMPNKSLKYLEKQTQQLNQQALNQSNNKNNGNCNTTANNGDCVIPVFNN